MPAGLPLDHVMPKTYSEVILTGSAYAIDSPVKAMNVRMQCGAIDKTLLAIGERTWHYNPLNLRCVADAKPFKTMPLGYEQAYGGTGYALNPLGQGFLPRLAFLRQRKGVMPNVEYPAAPLMPGRGAHQPATFAPMQLLQSPLREKSGTYDQQWLDEDFPGLPRDFDFRMFNFAPLDQQFEGSFAGGESYCLEGLHPALARIEGQLPTLRARAFILRTDGKVQADAAALEEVPLSCDTVWFFPDLQLGVMVYRGQARITDSDALDVGTVMVAYENTADAPRGLAHYIDVARLRLDRATAAQHAFNESQLAPERSPAAIAARALARSAYANAQLAERQAVLDELMAEFWQKSNQTPPANYQAPKAEAPALGFISPDELAEGDFDLGELLAKANALADSARSDGEAKLAAGKAQLPTVPAQDALSIEAQIQQAIAKASVVAHDLVQSAEAPPDALLPAMQSALLIAAQTTIVDPVQVEQARQGLAALPALQRAARAAAPTPTVDTPTSMALALGEQVMAWHRDGVVLAGRDMAGACLRGVDLSGADLREALLERADLRGASLVGANLKGAVLTAAQLDAADFSGANLDAANLCGSQALKTKFTRASMRGARAFDAVWCQADLRGTVLDDLLALRIDLSEALLDDTQLTRTLLSDAKAAGSHWRNSKWHMTIAMGAQMQGADFSGAQLSRSVLMDAQMGASQWSAAGMHTVYAGGKSNWDGASLNGAKIVKCGWRGASLAGADMRLGIFTQSDFGDADLSDALLDDAQFYRSLFLRSKLPRVTAQRTSFFQALCRKTDFGSANLSDAVLVQADTTEAIWAGARRDGAVLSQKASLS
ncbi:MAG: pentapeptide repeat-containing protein [Rhodocyclales bacterium]|nr:pentapeptide repeat-containing protein [Rhodocyclales bacterium]